MPSHLEGLKAWLEYVKPMLGSVEEFTYKGGSERKEIWGIIKRGVMARQYEALSAISQMADAGHGFLGVTFLRPAYEELIWLEFIDGHIADANEFAMLMCQHEIADQLTAQNNYAGRRGMTQLGLSQRMVKVNAARDRETQTRIKEIARQVGWETARNLYPTVFFMAKKIDRVKEFQYLYTATSRFVHFSPQEVMRRAWGSPGSLRIGSATFSKYWETFAIYWGFRIFVNLMVHCSDLLTSTEDDDQEYEDMTRWLAEFSQVPIITMEELNWPWPKS